MQQTEIKKKYTFFLGEDFFFFSVFSIAFNCSWQLIMFNKKQKSCVKRFQLVTDNFLFERKASYKVKIVFIHHLWIMANLSIINFEHVSKYTKFPKLQNYV